MSHQTVTSRAVLGELCDLLAVVRVEGHADKYAGKRKATRFRDGVFLELTTDPDDPAEVQSVHLHNLSEQGFACWVRNRIPVRKTVYLRQPHEKKNRPWVPGVVTHCTTGLRGFLIGGKFDEAPRSGR